MFPKPSKLFNSLRTSFRTFADVATAGVTQAVSESCVMCPFFFELCRSVARVDGGQIEETPRTRSTRGWGAPCF